MCLRWSFACMPLCFESCFVVWDCRVCCALEHRTQHQRLREECLLSDETVLMVRREEGTGEGREEGREEGESSIETKRSWVYVWSERNFEREREIGDQERENLLSTKEREGGDNEKNIRDKDLSTVL